MEDDSDKSVPDEAPSFVDVELETLQSIYIDEIDVKQDNLRYSVSIDLYPATADNHDEQYVRMTLKFTLSEEYPQTVPEIAIRNPRGLSEEKLFRITQHLFSIAESKVGNSMLYEIIEAAKEHLTTDNRPSGECAICLYGFSDEDVFTKTECYHYFHSHCLARYSGNASLEEESEKEAGEDNSAASKELVCPMCRLPIHFEGSEELFPPPSAADDEFVISSEMLEIQRRMANLFQKQVEKGGIIDIEAEKNKYLLEISDVPTRGNNAERQGDSEEFETEDRDAALPTDENTASSWTLQTDKDAKDISSTSKVSRNDSKSEEKSKSERYDKRYNKQPRNNYQESSYRTNRYNNNYSKYGSQKSNSRDKPMREEHETKEEVKDSQEDQVPGNDKSNPEDFCQDSQSELSPRSKPNFPFNRRNNRRTNSYGAPKRYGNERRDNYYRQSESNYLGNRDRRYGYERQNSRGQGYRGGYRRPNPRQEVSNEVDESESTNAISTTTTPDLNAREEGSEPSTEEQSLVREADREREEPKESRHNRGRNYSENSYREKRPYTKKKQYSLDGNAERRSSVEKEQIVNQEDESDVSQASPSKGEPITSRKYSDRQSSFRDRGHPDKRAYNSQDGFGRNSYGQMRQNYRRNSPEEKYESQDCDHRQEDNEDRYGAGSRERGGKYSSNRYQDRRQYDREDQGYFKERENNHYHRNRYPRENNPRRNYNREENSDRRNFNNDPGEHPRRHPDGNTDFRDEDNEARPPRRGNFSQDNRFKRNSNRGFAEHSRHQDDRTDDYVPRGGYRNPNRGNSYFQNKSSSYRNNQSNGRYNRERPNFREGSDGYRDKNGVSGSSNIDKCSQNPENSEGNVAGDFGMNSEHSVSRGYEKKSSDLLSEKAVVPKAHVNSCDPLESPCKESDVPPNPDVKAPALASFKVQKVLPPPPGFSNPLKKVVYGLQAANPPPGFPRS